MLARTRAVSASSSGQGQACAAGGRPEPVLVCGNAATIAPGVRRSLTRIFRDRTSTTEADAQAWLAGLRSADRFVEDIWGG
jgi:cytochrome P450/NADPH-cytochrome P450 reductase